MSIGQFVKKYNGKYLEYNNDAYKNQCKDLFSAYNKEVVGNDKYIYGDAKDLLNNAPKEYYDKAGTPQKGDAVIWGTGIGKYGHVAIFIEGNKNGFTSFDQNFPIDSPCHLQNHNYKNIIGYLRPKLTNNEIDMTIEELKKIFVERDPRFKFDQKIGKIWVVGHNKKYPLGTSPDDISILGAKMCGGNLSDEERDYPTTEYRDEVLGR
jgi:hypothetical protein